MNHRHRRNRMGIPRGLLQHLSLFLLKTGPMSGSELIERIEIFSEWRPSPGSMYPLLSNLQERELIKPHEDGETGLKRFIITQKGKEEIHTHGHREEEIGKRIRTFRKITWILMKGMPEDVYESFSSLFDTLDSTWDSLDESDVTRIKEILDNTKAELNKIGNKQNE